VVVVNWMAKPFVGTFGKWVIKEFQPVGGVTESGLVARKSEPGTHANQNVSIWSLLVGRFVSVIQ
jgi:hypothetical protein